MRRCQVEPSLTDGRVYIKVVQPQQMGAHYLLLNHAEAIALAEDLRAKLAPLAPLLPNTTTPERGEP